MMVRKDELESHVIVEESPDKKFRFSVEHITRLCPRSKETHTKISPDKARHSGLIGSTPLLYIIARKKENLLSRKVVPSRSSKIFPTQCWAFNKKLKVITG